MPVKENTIEGNSSSGTKADEEFERKRSPNRPWISELRGDLGWEQQRETFEDLGSYLFRVAWTYLHRRQGDIDILAEFTADELASLAQDFVQETLEKFARNDFAILEQYRGEAKFTAWAARVVTNQASAELRKSEWKRRSSMPKVESAEQRTDTTPEKIAVCDGVATILYSCIESLPSHYRRAFLGRIVEGETSKNLGEELGLTANAVDMLVFRAKPKLRKCLDISGIQLDVLEIFADAETPSDSSQTLCAG